tara:strand:+ start:517 stop:1926 length:1410 start_codon:yes stop_codon:yes gene_type:complete
LKINTAINWFRKDLRLSDNPSLSKASNYQNVYNIFILDEINSKDYLYGSASKFWLNNSLKSLNNSLDNSLSFYKGNPIDIFKDIISRFEINSVYWNRCYEEWEIKRDTEIKLYLKSRGINVETFNASLLWEPWEISKNDNTPYKVFTPFYRRGCLGYKNPREPLIKPKFKNLLKDEKKSLNLNEFELIPNLKWIKKLRKNWNIGEVQAQIKFEDFLKKSINSYKEGRDVPSKEAVSKISPHLHFGEISPNQLWYKIRNFGDDKNIDHFCSELGWREFSYSQLYFNPKLPKQNLQSKFDNFPWSNNLSNLNAWQNGMTGIPMVDAGMRELWQTGFMHNRLRMITGSFLVKNLLIHWHYGERWFWDCLVDADLASNSAGWQWIAGCGADAAPFFRIFNPVTQGQKFDPKGIYVRQYIPEIANLPNKYLFDPWNAPSNVLEEANINLGSTYPLPLVDLKTSREKALLAFKSI